MNEYKVFVKDYEFDRLQNEITALQCLKVKIKNIRNEIETLPYYKTIGIGITTVDPFTKYMNDYIDKVLEPSEQFVEVIENRLNRLLIIKDSGITIISCISKDIIEYKISGPIRNLVIDYPVNRATIEVDLDSKQRYFICEDYHINI